MPKRLVECGAHAVLGGVALLVIVPPSCAMELRAGELDDGMRYRPEPDLWLPVSLDGAPSPRRFHAAVWTGAEMIVWGGESGGFLLDTGARYGPSRDAWEATASPPLASRSLHGAHWTGREMVVWGGSDYDDGARYCVGWIFDDGFESGDPSGWSGAVP
jgi:hypothetical protein